MAVRQEKEARKRIEEEALRLEAEAEGALEEANEKNVAMTELADEAMAEAQHFGEEAEREHKLRQLAEAQSRAATTSALQMGQRLHAITGVPVPPPPDNVNLADAVAYALDALASLEGTALNADSVRGGRSNMTIH